MTLFGTAGATLAVAASSALGAPGYAGTTDQGNDISLRLESSGAVERVSYGWDMRCSGGGTLTNGGTISRPGRASATSFSSRGGYTAPIERKFEGAFKVRLQGERVDDAGYRGTFKVKAKVFRERNGELVTKCSTGIVGWTAELKGPAPGRAGTGALSLR